MHAMETAGDNSVNMSKIISKHCSRTKNTSFLAYLVTILKIAGAGKITH